MKSLSDIIKARKPARDYRNSKEFQAFGNMVAEELGDIKHRALYIKLAKTENRTLLEQALDFVKDAPHAHTKGRLFMWKLTQLKESKK
ncbi:MAG: hypothetical protein CO141_00155 [Candidatus Moranbacteria bacterium CG_4_9_14_3_um_filter_42_9]|nr:MAG: hypothetical protein CO141_00155 [Candidatus Moranbacteria bacterium CG_4_9_14_3_um_filter_42_9]